MRSIDGLLKRRVLKSIIVMGALFYIFLAAMLLFGVNGQAYIDPSVMTYVIQAVAGVVIAVGAAVGIYFRKAKRKVQDKLGIEDTKEQESDEIIVKSDETK